MSDLIEQLRIRNQQLAGEGHGTTSFTVPECDRKLLAEIERSARELGGRFLFVPDDKLSALLNVLDTGGDESGVSIWLDPSNPPEVNDPWLGLLGDCK